MSCSCQFPSRWLLPCTHICNVLDKREYFIPELMHIRWWKHFNYLYKNDHSNQQNFSEKSIYDTLEYVRKNHYDTNSGKYKGVPMHNNQFMVDLNKHNFNPDTCRTNKYFSEIMAIKEMMNNDGLTLIRGSNMYMKYMNIVNFNTDHNQESENNSKSHYDHVQAMIDENDYTLQSLGGGSQVIVNLSQQRTDMFSTDSCSDEDDYSMQDTSNKKSNMKHTNAYNRLYPLFCEVVGNIKNENQMKDAINIFEKLEFSLKATSHQGRVINDNDTTFLGEINGQRCVENRHKSWNEK
jgi:hypothetical protein